MANRPIFVPEPKIAPFFREINIEFEWHSGFAKVQAQKSIASLHASANQSKNISPILEISSKSSSSLGVALSAFNLLLVKENKKLSVECAYQGSKVFKNGGPYQDLYWASSRDAKTDERLRTSGDFVSYEFFGENFPINPTSLFYDWLYLNALSQNMELASELLEYQGFSDIAFNPQKSLNCQARSAALFVSLHQNDQLHQALEDKSFYIDLLTSKNLKTESSSKPQIGDAKNKKDANQLVLPI